MKDYVIGKTSTRPQDVPLMKECGFDFAESPVEWLLIPDEGEDAWKSQKEKIREAQKYMPFRSCNGFLPGRFHLTGPKPLPTPRWNTRSRSAIEPMKWASHISSSDPAMHETSRRDSTTGRA